MPDISMCMNNTCAKRADCYRHPWSGTQGSDYQSYSDFKPDENGECKNFWDKKQRTKGTDNG